jgi:uncharacterized membrane protein HdeD (DUF308 family)
VILSLPAAPTGLPADERASMRPLWWLFLAFGLVSILVGFLAISSTFIATMASVVVFGVLLLIAGFTELIHAFVVRNLKGFALHLLSAALYLFVGLFMLEHPLRAAAVLTLLIAAGFLVGGLLRIASALAVQFAGWPWVMFLGAIDLLLGVLILNEWPDSKLWVIGLFVGIDLLLNGWSWVVLALTVRTYTAPQPA